MSISLDTLAPYVVVPRCPLVGEAVAQSLRLAASEFSRRAGVWRETLTATPTGGEDHAQLTLPAGFVGTLGQLTAVRVNVGGADARTLPLAECVLGADLVLRWSRWTAQTGDTLDADVILWPDETVSAYPDELVSRWRRALIDGALATLLDLPGEPWADPAKAQLYRVRFEAEIQRAAGKGNSLVGRRFFGMSRAKTTDPAAPGLIWQRAEGLHPW